MSADIILLPAVGASATRADLNLPAMQAWHRAQRQEVSLFLQDGAQQVRAIVHDPASPLPPIENDSLAAWHRQWPQLAVAMRAGPSPLAALLDRDGTVIIDRHYLADPEGIEFLPGALAGLRRFHAAGVSLAIVTNQSGVGRGRITPQQLDVVHERIRTRLTEAGAPLAGIYACPHHPDDRCDCRKPAPGLVRQAAAALGLAPATTVIIGDRPADIDLGARTGIRTILVLTGEGRATVAGGARPDFVADDLEQAARICLHPAGLPVTVPLTSTNDLS